MDGNPLRRPLAYKRRNSTIRCTHVAKNLAHVRGVVPNDRQTAVNLLDLAGPAHRERELKDFEIDRRRDVEGGVKGRVPPDLVEGRLHARHHSIRLDRNGGVLEKPHDRAPAEPRNAADDGAPPVGWLDCRTERGPRARLTNHHAQLVAPGSRADGGESECRRAVVAENCAAGGSDFRGVGHPDDMAATALLLKASGYRT